MRPYMLVALLALASSWYEITAYVWTGDPTTSGRWPRVGATIACPRSMPFGTRLSIEGVGERVCEDRGPDIVEGRLDLFVADSATALRFGRQSRRVSVRP